MASNQFILGDLKAISTNFNPLLTFLEHEQQDWEKIVYISLHLFGSHPQIETFTQEAGLISQHLFDWEKVYDLSKGFSTVNANLTDYMCHSLAGEEEKAFLLYSLQKIKFYLLMSCGNFEDILHNFYDDFFQLRKQLRNESYELVRDMCENDVQKADEFVKPHNIAAYLHKVEHFILLSRMLKTVRPDEIERFIKDICVRESTTSYLIPKPWGQGRALMQAAEIYQLSMEGAELKSAVFVAAQQKLYCISEMKQLRSYDCSAQDTPLKLHWEGSMYDGKMLTKVVYDKKAVRILLLSGADVLFADLSNVNCFKAAKGLHPKQITDIGVFSDADYYLTTSIDGYTRVWDKNFVKYREFFTEKIMAALLLRQGRALLLNSTRKSIHLLSLNSPSIQKCIITEEGVIGRMEADAQERRLVLYCVDNREEFWVYSCSDFTKVAHFILPPTSEALLQCTFISAHAFIAFGSEGSVISATEGEHTVELVAKLPLKAIKDIYIEEAEAEQIRVVFTCSHSCHVYNLSLSIEQPT